MSNSKYDRCGCRPEAVRSDLLGLKSWAKAFAGKLGSHWCGAEDTQDSQGGPGMANERGKCSELSANCAARAPMNGTVPQLSSTERTARDVQRLLAHVDCNLQSNQLELAIDRPDT